MANINLYQSMQEEKSVSQKKGLMEKGFLIIILILIISLSLWGGLKLYNMILGKKISSLDSQITEESNRIESSKMDRVADFQERMNVIKANMPLRKDPSEFFGSLEKAMVPGVTLQSCDFTYDVNGRKDAVALTAYSDSFTLLSEQILSLKKLNYFESVELGNINRDQNGKINFVINAKFGG